jgi:Mg2+ and Co2+ transporter CorA
VYQELIITSFPQRWEQPKNDPLNVLEGIIEDTNAKTRPPIKSVYDLAMLITGRCSGMFDRHMLDHEEYQFLDMFERSLGRVTDRETALFERFNRASSQAAEWLKTHRRTRGGKRPAMASQAGGSKAPDHETDPRFQDDLLDIGTETQLLSEIKDIRDEINMIRTVLDNQKGVLPKFATHILEEFSRRSDEGLELDKRKMDQENLLDTHINDLNRMDKQAGLLYNSLTNLLDLKQKHANAFEARFARDQASLTARQGQTIMVFTIVTIVFLPMSFIAAFFAINIDDFPRSSAGGQGLRLSYVAKYMFGIGLGISVPLIAVAFLIDDITLLLRRWQYNVHEYLRARKKRKSDRKRKDKGEGAGDADIEVEKPPRLSNFSRSRGDTLDGPPRRSYGVDRGFSPPSRGFSPPPRKGTGGTQRSWASDHIRFRGASDDADFMRRVV